MLKWLARKLSPKRIDHPVFGSLLFMRMPDDTKSYWEGKGVFPPTGAEVEFFIDAGEEGPLQGQEQFWHKLCSTYESLKPNILAELSTSYASWFSRQPPVEVSTVFALSSLSIPRADSPNAAWELTYDCVEDPEHIFTVAMREWRPAGGVRIDG
jgi:hypothetical protein